MKKSTVLALCYLFGTATFLYGYVAATKKIWPSRQIENVLLFVKGHKSEESSLLGKIKNDLGIVPSRFLHEFSHKPTPTRRDIELPEGVFRARDKKPFIETKAKAGYWAIHGTFVFKDNFHGTILVNHAGEIVKHWTAPTQGSKMPQGMELLSDGRLVTNMGGHLTAYDWCSKQIWSTDKHTNHHSIKGTYEQGIWGWSFQDKLTKYEPVTGDILKVFSLADIVRANPDYHGFELNSRPGDWEFTEWKGRLKKDHYHRYYNDPFHPNAIAPLPKAYASAFPQFNSGDLLVSLRNLNLIFVIDPVSLKVKWHSQGLVSRQHDPEWTPWGTISVYNNRMHLKHTNIDEISIVDKTRTTVVSGQRYGIRSRIRGDHQVLPDGGHLVVSPLQGRVVHVNKVGQIIFEFVNRYDATRALEIQNALYIESSKVNSWERSCHQAE